MIQLQFQLQLLLRYSLFLLLLDYNIPLGLRAVDVLTSYWHRGDEGPVLPALLCLHRAMRTVHIMWDWLGMRHAAEIRCCVSFVPQPLCT